MKVKIISLAARLKDTADGQEIYDWQIMAFIDMCDGSKADVKFFIKQTFFQLNELVEDIKKWYISNKNTILPNDGTGITEA